MDAKKYNYNITIVEMNTIQIFDFIYENETKEEAETRGNKYYIDELALVTSHLNNYGGDYWKNQVEAITKKVQAGCKVMTYEEYKQLERNHLLSDKLQEIDADIFEEMLNVLPPIKWCTIGNVEMFCMSEMYTGTFTNQYAHDKHTNKYYRKLVDITDETTWINELLRK